MDENEIAKIVVDSAFKSHSRLGPRLLESVYKAVLCHELSRRALYVKRQIAIPIVYDGLKFDEGFRVDLIVNDKIIVELKCVEQLSFAHKKPLLIYLRLAQMRLGLLINFSQVLLKDGIRRVVNGLDESRASPG